MATWFGKSQRSRFRNSLQVYLVVELSKVESRPTFAHTSAGDRNYFLLNPLIDSGVQGLPGVILQIATCSPELHR